jgi:membrane associated rhomboid family serine protease
MVFLINNLFLDGRWLNHGIIPRHWEGLPGILWGPFLHNSFGHLTANTFPLLILGGILCARGKGEFVLVGLVGLLVTGSLTWILGRPASHVGASGLIFCMFGYLASLAWFHRKLPTLLLSLLCIVLYGGMLRGILPTASAVSWEGHLAGLISGIGLAWASARAEKAL